MLTLWIILLVLVFVVGSIVAKHDDDNYQEFLKQLADKGSPEVNK